MTRTKPLLLCGGMQSSGSTLLSWCFLQRPDTDGVLDARFDVLPCVPEVATENCWVKMTVSCFRLADAVEHFTDEGFEVRPVLLVRDVRAIFNSLIRKEYCRNGTTADDPPIRLRLRRFKRDWKRARRLGWTLLRFEDLVSSPRRTLEIACGSLGLRWNESMLLWPKPMTTIADARHGNETFIQTRSGGFDQSVRPLADQPWSHIPEDDLHWLESEFADFNATHGYPVSAPASHRPTGRAIPSYEVTRRYWRVNHGAKSLWRRFARAIHL